MDLANYRNICISDARRICYTLIDLTANGLKSALSGRESEYMCEKIKSSYHRARHESLAAPKCALQKVPDDYENFAQPRRSFTRKPKIFVDADNVGLVYSLVTLYCC